MIAVHTPVAGNLRLLLMISRTTVELERIADLTIDIDHCAQGLLKENPLKPMIDLPRMAEISMEMLRKAIDAFVDGSIEKALAVVKMDDMVDHLNDQIVRELMTYVMGDPRNINRVLGLILISRAVERIADHAVNIAENVVYMVKGEDIRHIKAAAEPVAHQDGDQQVKI